MPGRRRGRGRNTNTAPYARQTRAQARAVLELTNSSQPASNQSTGDQHGSNSAQSGPVNSGGNVDQSSIYQARAEQLVTNPVLSANTSQASSTDQGAARQNWVVGNMQQVPAATTAAVTAANLMAGQAEPRRTWIIGDSLVVWAGEGNTQLSGGGEVMWKGLSGGRMAAVDSRLYRLLRSRTRPTTVIIHLGTNDIFTSPLKDLKNRIEENLKSIRKMLPDTRIIWSDIITRLFYYGEKSKGSGIKCKNQANKFAHKIIKGLTNAHYVCHGIGSPHASCLQDMIHLEGWYPYVRQRGQR
ncbi:uncharacterized protein [Amphiura filiformis]|uniref:uncharacterized protein n=1 Tax=Amphiura filiformis TaxID=82378 RepID=UPI003B216CA4